MPEHAARRRDVHHADVCRGPREQWVMAMTRPSPTLALFGLDQCAATTVPPGNAATRREALRHQKRSRWEEKGAATRRACIA